MPDTIYTAEGLLFIQGANVSVIGPNLTDSFGDPGTQLIWTNALPSASNFSLTDVDGDQQLVVGVDDFGGSSFTFTGYTATAGGVDYPIFSNGSNFYIALDADPFVSGGLGASGTSNVYQGTVGGGNLYLCFAAGTAIATPTGETVVETLSPGDQVLTAEGCTVAVKWIGRQTVSTRFGQAERLMPVRFAAGALGDGLPYTDLIVTADHAMLIEGVLCHAGALVNGTSIRHVPPAEMGESYTVYHIETEEHEIILANGAPAETFIDNVSRRVFDNFAEFEALYGDVPEMLELDYPRAM